MRWLTELRKSSLKPAPARPGHRLRTYSWNCCSDGKLQNSEETPGISYSPDLRFWGESQLIMRPEQYHWDEMKIGPGAPPIKTEHGWLSIYHGVFRTMDGSVYRLGVALHDLVDPAKIVGVGDSWILQPEDPWEVTGYVHNVVFTCGAVAESDGTVKIYWGGADTVMCVGEANISDLVALCLNHGRPAK